MNVIEKNYKYAISSNNNHEKQKISKITNSANRFRKIIIITKLLKQPPLNHTTGNKERNYVDSLDFHDITETIIGRRRQPETRVFRAHYY